MRPPDRPKQELIVSELMAVKQNKKNNNVSVIIGKNGIIFFPVVLAGTSTNKIFI